MDCDASTAPTTLLEEIDRQQDDLLAELDALNSRIEIAIRQWLQTAGPQEADSLRV